MGHSTASTSLCVKKSLGIRGPPNLTPLMLKEKRAWIRIGFMTRLVAACAPRNSRNGNANVSISCASSMTCCCRSPTPFSTTSVASCLHLCFHTQCGLVMCMQKIAKTIHTRFINTKRTARIRMAKEITTYTTEREVRLSANVNFSRAPETSDHWLVRVVINNLVIKAAASPIKLKLNASPQRTIYPGPMHRVEVGLAVASLTRHATPRPP